MGVWLRACVGSRGVGGGVKEAKMERKNEAQAKKSFPLPSPADNAPGTKVSASLLICESCVASTAGAVLATHLEH